jgi:hypothetical protein
MADTSVSVDFTASVSDFISGVSQARDALANFADPIAQINGQLASLTAASSQAFSAGRLQVYTDMLSATASLERSFASDRTQALAAQQSGDQAAYADAMRAGQLASNEEIKILEDNLKQKLAAYAEDARLYQITQQEKIAQSRQALDEELGGELAIYTREAALNQQKVGSAQRVQDQMIDAEMRYNNQMSSLTRSALAEQQQDYQAFANAVTQSFNSQLHGLITGTTSWQTAYKAVLADLLVRFIEWGEETIVHTIVAEAAKTAATTSGVAARTGAEAAGASASIGVQGAAMIRSIISSAAETFAGVFGFLSPLLGPFAAAPAAAAQASVASMAGSVASADIGMWSVPEDMLTLVHHNELVMPAMQASAFRDMLAGAGPGAGAPVHIHPTTSFHVSAVDSGSVAQWMRANGRDMMKAIDEAVRHGAALGLRRLSVR